MKNLSLVLAGSMFLLSAICGFLTFTAFSTSPDTAEAAIKFSYIFMVAGSAVLILAGLKKN
tara:strand:- start:437 stop:619 length:183 start_codon:yes stop_codon:yes gene_type:complete